MYFGDNVMKNSLLHEGIGGAGGGALLVQARHVEVDGDISVDGGSTTATHHRAAGE